ncbi:MAG TPA: DUF1643 domain-containing protein [Candidatus Binataceae bacterium]|nr:DUF1643 domain-containing protein [Candidatus Binataceae bacterium]
MNDELEGDFATRGSAIFSRDGRYRYRLTRQWRRSRSAPLTFILLNPSTADATRDDPTIRRCVGFAKARGYCAMTVVNLFTLRSTDPSGLYLAGDPVGPRGDAHIERAIADSAEVIVGWGAHGDLLNRGKAVMDRFRDCNLLAFGLTRNRQPRHPLYLPNSAPIFSLRALLDQILAADFENGCQLSGSSTTRYTVPSGN